MNRQYKIRNLTKEIPYIVLYRDNKYTYILSTYTKCIGPTQVFIVTDKVGQFLVSDDNTKSTANDAHSLMDIQLLIHEGVHDIPLMCPQKDYIL